MSACPAFTMYKPLESPEVPVPCDLDTADGHVQHHGHADNHLGDPVEFFWPPAGLPQ